MGNIIKKSIKFIKINLFEKINENINQLLSHILISPVLFISLMAIFLDYLSNYPQSTLGE